MPEAVVDASPERARSRSTRILVFCSGKGGTGRTTLVATLAAASIDAGLRVRMVDADGATAGLTRLLCAAGGALSEALETQQDFERAVERARTQCALAATACACESDTRRDAMQAPLRAFRDGGAHDLVLVDAAAGDSADTAALAAVADGLVLVADPSSLQGGQEHRLMQAFDEAWRAGDCAPAWCRVLVNRAPPGIDGGERAAIARSIGARVDRVALVGLDMQALQGGRPHDAVALDRPATRFADEAMRAFGALLETEQGAWPDVVRERWQALASAKARAVARTDAQRELEAAADRKRLDRWTLLEGECVRLRAELEHVRNLRAQEQLRQNLLVEELRQQHRLLRFDRDAAQERAAAHRAGSLAAISMGFAAGALLVATTVIWLGHAGILAGIEGRPLAVAPPPDGRPGAGASTAPAGPTAANARESRGVHDASRPGTPP